MIRKPCAGFPDQKNKSALSYLIYLNLPYAVFQEIRFQQDHHSRDLQQKM